ncbi:MAG: cobyric acid synthase [Peptacetobacter hiranonis]|nr:cobyric acid synthase [Peptacetobacter hiranonis]
MKGKIMFQGTASNVGKSIIAAGMCRIFAQDGYKVAPFKPQNMALNSFITDEGLEMGRAQVFQAEAAGIKPKADMNPILLKPCGNHRSQVIVRGKVVGEMHSSEYHEYKLELVDILKDTFSDLENEYDVIVMEGAGSCAEINLKERDISNMGMAQIADAPVVLVSDIDRGGVFASIVGTLALLTEDERKRVKGVIINKFRGKKEYFAEGVKMLEDIIHIPVLGVVPYSDIKIEDEDSVTTRFKKATKKNDINIEIVRTPHMSNFTDFNIFETQSDVSLRYVDFGESIGNPDMLIIPGTKSTVDDLKYLRETGLEEQIKECARRGKLVFGICGGYQMLGKKIVDKYGVESDDLEVEGIGLLNTVTEFEKEKTTVQIERVISDNVQGYLNDVSGKKVKGYEIHMGTTTKLDECVDEIFASEPTGLMDKNIENCLIGCSNSEGNVVGTYLHGIFDEIDFTRTLLNTIRAKKGLEPITSEVESFEEFKNREYDRLADMLRENLDMEKIYEIVKNSSK